MDELQNNPFTSLVNVIRDDNKRQIPAYYRLGTVLSVNPLIIDVAGNSQDKDELLKNELISNLEVGDNVLLMPIEDEQKYIILCKVVSV